MNKENEIIKSCNYNIKKFVKIVIVVAVLFTILNALGSIIGNYNYAKYEYNDVINEIIEEHESSYPNVSIDCDCNFSWFTTLEAFQNAHPNAISYMECHSSYWSLFDEYDLQRALVPQIITIFAILLYKWLGSYSITITNKRVYGKTSFGKQVDLPLDSISSVGTSFLKGVSVGTSSGRIHFKLIKNQETIHNTINKLLLERQKEKEEKNEAVQLEKGTNVATEIKNFKELLDMGAITQEEFNQKKKELLGL